MFSCEKSTLTWNAVRKLDVPCTVMAQPVWALQDVQVFVQVFAVKPRLGSLHGPIATHWSVVVRAVRVHGFGLLYGSAGYWKVFREMSPVWW